MSVDRLSAVGDRLEQPGKVDWPNADAGAYVVLAETGASDPEAFVTGSR